MHSTGKTFRKPRSCCLSPRLIHLASGRSFCFSVQTGTYGPLQSLPLTPEALLGAQLPDRRAERPPSLDSSFFLFALHSCVTRLLARSNTLTRSTGNSKRKFTIRVWAWRENEAHTEELGARRRQHPKAHSGGARASDPSR